MYTSIKEFRSVYYDAILVYNTYWKDCNYAIISGILGFEKYINTVYVVDGYPNLGVFNRTIRLSEWSNTGADAWKSAYARFDSEVINRFSE